MKSNDEIYEIVEVAECKAAVMTRKNTAKFLGICLTTLDGLDIPKTRIGRKVYYKKDVLNKWLDGRTEKKKRGKA